MIPGEIRHPAGAGPIQANVGLAQIRLAVSNTGDRPIQVGSHFHFFEVNTALSIRPGKGARFRLNVFQPAPPFASNRASTKEVTLVALAGEA